MNPAGLAGDLDVGVDDDQAPVGVGPDEIHPDQGIAPHDVQLRPQEVQLARTLMDAVTEDFHIEAEHDEYTYALEQVVEARLAGVEPPHAPRSRVLPPGGTAPDPMAVLEAALVDARGQHSGRAEGSHRWGPPGP